MTRVLVLSSDYTGAAMAGPAIRYYHLAEELAKHFAVTLAIPNEAPVAVEGADVLALDRPSPAELSRAIEPFDVVVTQMLPLPTIKDVTAAGKRVIYDLYNPFLAETLAFFDVEEPSPADVWFAKTSRLTQRVELQTGSAFICASERQRDVWLGVLGALGRIDLAAYRRDETLRNLIDIVPFGLPSQPPLSSRRVLKGVFPGIREHDRVLLWAGGVWNWLDPLTPIRAVAEIAKRRDDVKLLFLGLRHPSPRFAQMAMAERAVELARSLDVLDRFVFFNPDWVPYAKRHEYLLEADLGVSAHYDILETRYAFRTRLLDHFWAGLPTATTRGDVLADLVAQRGLGRVLDFEDVGGWVAAVEELVDDETVRARIRDELDVVRADLSWPRVVRPLVRLVEEASGPRRVATRAVAVGVQERWLRLRTSLALGGVAGLARRRAERIGRAAGRAS